MARGPIKHMKKIRAPRSWLLSKMNGVYTVRPAQGPHKLRNSLPLTIILRNKLGYAYTGNEVTKILR